MCPGPRSVRGSQRLAAQLLTARPSRAVTATSTLAACRARTCPNEKGVAMKGFVAGATGALGKQLVPMLVAKGHEVVRMTRTEAKRDQLRSVGAQPVVADALDADAVGRAVGAAEPDVIVHQLTAHRRRSTCDASIAS